MQSKILRNSIIIIISALAYGFIIYKIIQFEELKSFDFNIFVATISNFLLLVVTLVLMVVNWSIESLKWQKLINKIQYFSFYDSLKAVISGVTVGIFTPNRVGEIGGRIAFLEKGRRTYGTLVTSIGSYAQFISTLIMGVMAFFIFLLTYPEKTSINPIFSRTSAFILLIILAFLIWGFFNVKKIIPILLRIHFFKKRSDQLYLLSSESRKLLASILVLSLLRYFVFFIQFYMLLYIFNCKLSIIDGFISISLTYLFMTIIPTTTLIELGIRGSLAILFVGLFSENVLGIVLASIILWIINIAIPAVAGSYFLIKSGNRKTFVKQDC